MKQCPHCASRFATTGWHYPSSGWAPAYDEGIPMLAPDLARGEIGRYESALFESHGGDQADRSFWTQARAALVVWALRTYATVRLVAMLRAGKYDSADEFKIGPLNEVCAQVMYVERWAIRNGARLPFGGSLLIVARKAAI